MASTTLHASGTFSATQKNITSSTNTTPITIHIVGHGFTTGDIVYIANHTTNTAANGFWTIIVTGADDFTLTNSVGVGVGGATGTVMLANESTLSSIASIGEYTLEIDTNLLATGDMLAVRVYQMTLTGGTERVLYFAGWQGAQPTHDQAKHSVKIGNDLTDATSLKFTIQQILGTHKSIPWKILRYTTSPQGIEKNVALTNFEFAMFDDLGNLKPSLSSFTSQYSLDGAAYASLSGTVSAIGSGLYKIDTLSAAELNGRVITLSFAATGARTKLITIITVDR